VLAIKQTLYRTSDDTAMSRRSSGQPSRASRSRARGGEARFDEQANILWARQLERAGVHVVYGLVGLKTHSKIVLVVRREEEAPRYCNRDGQLQLRDGKVMRTSASDWDPAIVGPD